VTVPNTAVSVTGPGALLDTVVEVVGAPDTSMATGPTPGRVAASTVTCPVTAKMEVGEPASVLMSGPPAAAEVFSVEGATRLVADTAVPGLPTVGCTRIGSFLVASEVCRGA
jgi:hypothetical protein